MTVELSKIDFEDKVVKGKDGVERRQLSLISVPETPPTKPKLENTPPSPTKLPISRVVSFVEGSQPREYDE